MSLYEEITAVFQAHPDKYNHLHDYPWLLGSLGDPSSAVWFWAENPSLVQVEKVTNASDAELTPEVQWSASRGDQLFRENLVRTGFKTTGVDIPGGWNCYITNIIKECDYVKSWRERADQSYKSFIVPWIPVLQYEQRQYKPKLSVIMGNKPQRAVKVLKAADIHFGKIIKIHHYSYIAHRPAGKLGPMHPERVEKYNESFDAILAELNLL